MNNRTERMYHDVMAELAPLTMDGNIRADVVDGIAWRILAICRSRPLPEDRRCKHCGTTFRAGLGGLRYDALFCCVGHQSAFNSGARSKNGK